MKLYFKVFIQIFLIISMSWAFSYLVHQTDNLVSAQDEEIIHTCIESKDGKICQEYLADECGENCKDSCVQASREYVGECRLGTCYDEIEGTCSSNSPRKECEENGGEWSEGSRIECRLGCCLFGDQSEFVTKRGCERIQETSGILTEFKSEINSELGCYLEFNNQVEGACVFYSGEEKICKFVTGRECLELESREAGIEFYENFLCSHPDLNMDYEKQFTTSCIEGKEEVYWIDDHGNRENIYEGDTKKESSWNNGLVKPKSESCDPLGLEECGNCNSLLASTTCDDSSGEAVCEDISCEWQGKTYYHKESWCYYQGAVLPQGGTLGLERSSTTPGSRHFLMWCDEGEIYNTSCGDKRAEICYEEHIEREEGGDLSLANCRENLAYLCLEYNTWDNKTAGMEKCEENPDCYIKQVRVSRSNVNFDSCVPKYSPGFDFTSEDIFENGGAFCGLASMSCNAARVKKVSGAWEWVNKGCLSPEFTAQMNDFCMSLGDCGGSVNYIGEFSGSGYSISGSYPLTKDYIDSIDYSENPEGEYIEAVNTSELYSSVGWGGGVIGAGTGEANFPEDITKTQNFQQGVQGLGSGGMLLWQILPTYVAPKQVFFWTLPGKTPLGGLTPFLGAIAGAAIAASLVGLLISSTGVGAGMPPDLVIGILSISAVAGGVIAYAAISGGGLGASFSTLGALGVFPVIGWIALAVIAAFITILYTMNVGKIKTYTVSFQCKPWQPPLGDDNCDKCYDDGFGCSKYACESLGTACEFLNEGTSFETCAGFPDDGGPPGISPLEEVVPDGFRYEDVSENGFRVVSGAEDKCIPASTLVTIGLKLDEPGRCTFAVDSGIYDEQDILQGLNESDFDPEDFGLRSDFLSIVWGESNSMYEEGFTINQGMEEFYFGGNNIFLFNHTHPLYFPSLSSLGLGGFDPERRIDFDMKIRCEDRHGNKNPKDYVIRACLSPEQNIDKPHILDQDPIDGLFKNNATSVDFSVYTHEPAECKWSLQDKDYLLMENSFDCENNPKTDLRTRAGGSFKCDSSTLIASDNLTIYVRCKDQPWLEQDEKRNTMDKSYNLTLKRSSPLKIDTVILNSNRELKFGTVPAEIKVEVKTSGGGYNGKSRCSYLSGNFYTEFRDTYGKTHTQIFDKYTDTSGRYSMSIICEDSIGNTAFEKNDFIITIDSSAPKVTRAFRDGTKLKIITNEKAACYYNNKWCGFNIEEADLMSIGFSTSHTVEWKPGATYYIRCKDTWGHLDSGCSIIIKPEEI